MQKQFSKPARIPGYGNAIITVTIDYSDTTNDGYDTFLISVSIKNRNRTLAVGFLREEIIRYFPELYRYIKWHGFTSLGPVCYRENVAYHIKNYDLKSARAAAFAPTATANQLINNQWLEDNLNALLTEFQTVLSLLSFGSEKLLPTP